MNKEEKRAYIQDAHQRYIIDHYSRNNNRTIHSRKTYLVYRLGLGLVAMLALAFFFPNFKGVFLGVSAVIVYLLGVEIGRRQGYIKAYVSLVKSYDWGYFSRWKELRKKEHDAAGLTHVSAYANVQNFLNGNDFPVNVELTDEEE